jgi:inward rectifier potassium channel
MNRHRRPDIFEEQLHDLGFGSKVTQVTRYRLLNKDGSSNVDRKGLPLASTLSPYHTLLTMPWWKFHLLLGAGFLLFNLLFAALFLAAGGDALGTTQDLPMLERFLDAFFFSVQTFTTVGYGHINPHGIVANMLAAFDAFLGLISFAFATGLLFARFSRPTAKIIFSEKALIAPYRDGKAFEIRIANMRSSQLIDVEARIVFSRFDDLDGNRFRRFVELKLERRKVAFFPLAWTIVHPIDEESPLHGLTDADLHASGAEFLLLITAIDETFSQTVHTRTSYRFDEIVWDAAFDDIYAYDADGRMSADLKRIHAYH